MLWRNPCKDCEEARGVEKERVLRLTRRHAAAEGQSDAAAIFAAGNETRVSRLSASVLCVCVTASNSKPVQHDCRRESEYVRPQGEQRRQANSVRRPASVASRKQASVASKQASQAGKRASEQESKEQESTGASPLSR